MKFFVSQVIVQVLPRLFPVLLRQLLLLHVHHLQGLELEKLQGLLVLALLLLHHHV